MKKNLYFKMNQTIDENYNKGICILYNENNICYSQKSQNIVNRIYALINKGTKFTAWNYINDDKCVKYYNSKGLDYHQKKSINCIDNNTKINKNDLFFEDKINIKCHPGIYFLYLDSELKYVGQSNNVFRRIANGHAVGNKNINQWNFFPCNENHMNLAEAICIVECSPPDNNSLPDNTLFISRNKLLRIEKYLDDDYFPKTNIRVGNYIYYKVDEVIKSLTHKLKKSKGNNIFVSKKSLLALEMKELMRELSGHEKKINEGKICYQLIDVVASMMKSYKKALKVKGLILNL